MSAQPAFPERLRRLLPLALAIVVVLAVYAPVIDAPFLWDDWLLIELPLVQRLDWPWNYLSSPFLPAGDRGAGGGLFFRPVATFSLAVDRALHGGNAGGFHLTNLFLHLTALVLVYVLARRYGAARPAAALAGTLFGVMPRLTESVAWIAGRTDVLCTVFVLAGWVTYRRGDTLRTLLASLFAFLALLAKESGFALVIALLVSELLPRPSKAALKRVVPLLGLTALYLVLRTRALYGLGTSSELGALKRVATILEAVGRYAFMLVDPWQPRPQLGLINLLDYRFVAFGGAVLAVLILALWKSRHAWTGDLVFAALVAGVPLALVIHVVPMPWFVLVADRMLYLPLAGLAVIVAPQLNRVFSGFRLLAIVVFGLAASLAITTFRVVNVYVDPAEFWMTAVETTPKENFGPTYNLAVEFSQAGLLEDALVLIESAEQRHDVTGAQRAGNLARLMALTRLGRYRELFEIVDKLPMGENVDYDLARARVLLSFDRVKEARRVAQSVHDRNPKLLGPAGMLKQLDRLEEDRRKLEDPSLTRFERGLLQARVELHLGRRPEATRACLALLEDPETPRGVLEETMAILAGFASYADLSRGAALYRKHGPPSPVVAIVLEEKVAAAQRLFSFRPRIEAALGVKFAR